MKKGGENNPIISRSLPVYIKLHADFTQMERRKKKKLTADLSTWEHCCCWRVCQRRSRGVLNCLFGGSEVELRWERWQREKNGAISISIALPLMKNLSNLHGVRFATEVQWALSPTVSQHIPTASILRAQKKPKDQRAALICEEAKANNI